MANQQRRHGPARELTGDGGSRGCRSGQAACALVRCAVRGVLLCAVLCEVCFCALCCARCAFCAACFEATRFLVVARPFIPRAAFCRITTAAFSSCTPLLLLLNDSEHGPLEMGCPALGAWLLGVSVTCDVGFASACMSVFDLKLLLSLSILFMAADEAGC